MPDEQRVNTTLREVIGDSVSSQTQKKSDDTSSSHTDSGAKQKEIVAGIDVSDIPDNMTKAEFKDYLAKKGKLVDDGANAKFREIAEYKKERDAIVGLGVTPQKAAEIIRESLRNNETKSEVKKDLKREIETLMEEAPDLETRRGVERLRRIIKEESLDAPIIKELKERLDKAEKALGYFQNKTIQGRADTLTEALDKLSGEKFDKDFIENIKEKVIEHGKKYPDASVSRLIQAVSDPDDYDAALLKTKSKEQSKENRIKEKINANDSASSGVTGSERKFDVKKTPMKDLLSHVFAGKK